MYVGHVIIGDVFLPGKDFVPLTIIYREVIEFFEMRIIFSDKITNNS